MQKDEKPEAWREAMDLAAEIYKRIASFPTVEIEGLAAQIRQAAAVVLAIPISPAMRSRAPRCTASRAQRSPTPSAALDSGCVMA